MPTSAVAADVSLDIIARAASPEERAAGGCFAPNPQSDAGAIAAREREWTAAAAGGDPNAWARLLAAQGLTEERFRAGLAEVVVADASRLPRWARELRLLLAGPAAHAPDVEPFCLREVFGDDTIAAAHADRDGVWSAHRLFEPFLRVAAARLDHILAASRIAVAPSARRQMLAQLAARWSGLAAQALYHRIDVLDLLDGLPGELGSTVYAVHCAGGETALAQWHGVLRVYPVLGRLMAIAHWHWARAIGRLVRRLARDAALVARDFMQRDDPGPLVGYAADAGDVHDGGQTVTLLTFDCGRRVVYKPKDLRIAAWYMALVGRLNDEGLSPPLPRRRILPRGAYTWEEFVFAGSCDQRDAVRRFYRRMGMHVRLIQLLDGTDFTTDNVLPCAEHPVLVDLEMLLSPHRRLAPSASPNERAAHERAWDSPHRSGLVTAKIAGDPGVKPADVGALAPASARVAPFKQTAMCRGEDGSVHLAREYPRFGGNSATPLLNGQPVNPDEFYGDVVDGYRRMTACLRRAAPRLFAEGAMLDAAAALPVRLLWRDTHIYARLLEESLRPHRLRDGVSREMCLQRLWKSGLESPDVVRCEIDSLRDVDIPLFGGRPSDDIVRGPAGLAAHDQLEGTSLERCRARIRALPNATGAFAADQIRTALFQLAPAHRLRVPVAPRPAACDWLGEAVRIGDAILGAAISGRHGAPSWVGLTYDPWTDAWAFGPLQSDLLSGTAGLAVVLADLGRVSGLSRFGDAARSILYPLADRLDTLARTLGDPAPRRRAAERPPCGAWVGWGAWLYACTRGGRVLGEGELARQAQRCIERIPLAALREDGADMLAGTAGLLTVWRAKPEPPTHLPNAIGRDLLEAWNSADGFQQPPFPANADVLRCLPSNESGTCLALLGLARRTGDDRFAEPWRERTARSAADGCAPPASSSAALDLFAALGAGAGEPEPATRAVRAFMGALGRVPTAREQLEAAELAMTAYQFTGDSTLAAAAAAFARRLMAGHGATRRWFPESLAADRYHLSAVTGVGALAHLFLKLEDPARVPSLRLLSPIA